MARRRANSAKIDPALFHRSASSVTLTEDVITAYVSILRAEGLAERLNVTRQTISAFEGGQREMPWNVFLACLMLFFPVRLLTRCWWRWEYIPNSSNIFDRKIGGVSAMVIILLLLIVIIAIPICIRRSHHSRLNDRSVTETAHLIAKKVYSEAQEYAAAHGLNLDRDIVSFYVGTQGVSIQYLDGIQQVLYIDLGYSLDTLNGCDLKLLRINQSIVEKFGSDKWAVRIVTESGKLIPEEDLRVKIHHSDWYSFVSFKCGSKDIPFNSIEMSIVKRSELDRFVAETNRYASAKVM